MEPSEGNDSSIALRDFQEQPPHLPWMPAQSRSSTLTSIINLFPPEPSDSVECLTRGEQVEVDVDATRRRSRSRSRSYTSSVVPPADRGRHAWFFLASCFVVEALVWGFPFSFGVFQEYYSTHEPFMADSSGIAVIGTTSTGIMYIAGAFLFPIFNKWPRVARICTIGGLPIMAAGLLAASFATKVWHLILTQGVIYGIGGSIVYYATIMFLDEWFVQMKGAAFGVMWGGTGAAGLVIPFIMNFLLQKYGIKTTLRVWAVVVAVCSKPLMFFLKPRLPPSKTPRSYSFKFHRTSTYWFLQIANIVQSLGYFLPGIYLPSFARSLGLSTSSGTLLIALINAAGVCSAVSIGILVDKFNVASIISISTLGSSVSVLLFWGFATTLPQLCIFSCIYGLFAGGFTSTYTGMIKELKKHDERTDTGLLVGMLSAGRGIGAVLSGPLSEKLLEAVPTDIATQGYGSGYNSLIVFTGVTGAVGSLTFFARKLGWI